MQERLPYSLWSTVGQVCYPCEMNNYIVRSYRDIIVITKFAITKYAIRRASKAQSIVIIKTKNILKNINKNNRLSMGKFSKVP